MTDELFCNISVTALNMALKERDHAAVNKTIEKLEIAGLKDEANNLRKICQVDGLSHRHGHMSKAERRAKKEKNKQFKESSFMYPKEETFKFQHSKPVPLEELLGNVRLLKKPRLSQTLGIILHPTESNPRMKEKLPSLNMKLRRRYGNFPLIVPENGGYPRLFERLPSIEMKLHRHLEKYQLAVPEDGGHPRLFERLPSIEMKLHRHLERYQIVVPSDGGNPRLREKLPTLSMKRCRHPESYQLSIPADGGSPRILERLPSIEMKLHRQPERYQLVVPADGGRPKLLERLPSVDMLHPRKKDIFLLGLDHEIDLELGEGLPTQL
mmetsp:Transcript_7485/g.8996  ORF Transcript_7485/g.8996 Transcript_7485/m.8996 type:complete len:325 (-) Transcript_7485:80-1054(-)